MMPNDVKITFMDRTLFAMRRFYNRTFGAYFFSWNNDQLTIFGYSIMSKLAVNALHSTQARENLKAGLSAEEYREICQALEIISVLPTPELADGSFSERQMAECGIRIFCNRFYVFTTA